MKHDENLREKFNMDPPEQPVEPYLPVVQQEAANDSADAEEQNDDYNLARGTLRNIIRKSESTLDEVLLLARSNEHPRTYEVAGQLIKTMSEVAKDLLDLHRQKKELKGPVVEEQTNIRQQNNIVFAGSTQELLKAMQAKTIENDSPTQ